MNERLFSLLKQLDAVHRLAWAYPALTAALRSLSFIAYRAIEIGLGRWHPHVRTVRSARSLDGGTAPSTGPNVLFVTVRGWFAHVSTEVVLARALELRGAKASFFLCGGQTAQCDFKPATDPRVTKPLCYRCRGFGRRILEASGFGATELVDLLSGDEISAHEAACAALDRQALLEHEYRGHPIGQYVLPSVHRSLLRGDIPDDRRTVSVLRGFVASGRALLDAFERLYDLEPPDIVVVTNGTFFSERIALELAAQRGAEVVSYERGFRPDSIVLERGRAVVPYDTTEYFKAEAASLSPAARARVVDYLSERSCGRGNVGAFWPSMQADPAQLVSRLGLDPAKPTAALFTNILWDSAVFGRDEGFADMLDWVFRTIEVFASRPDRQLLVRVHPAEVRLTMSETRDRVIDRIREVWGEDLPPNIVVIPPDDPASSYALMELASVIMVYTSTVGLEAATRGHRVLVGGRTHYSDKGFTTTLSGPAGLEEAIDEALRSPRLEASSIELALAYAHFFFFEYTWDFPWVSNRSRASRDLRVEDLRDLEPGASADLDGLCDVILGRRLPVRWPESEL